MELKENDMVHVREILHLLDIKAKNEQMIPIQELREGKYKKAYTNLLVELHNQKQELMFVLPDTLNKDVKQLCVDYIDIIHGKEERWQEFIQDSKKISEEYHDMLVDGQIKQVALFLDGLYRKGQGDAL